MLKNIRCADILLISANMAFELLSFGVSCFNVTLQIRFGSANLSTSFTNRHYNVHVKAAIVHMK